MKILASGLSKLGKLLLSASIKCSSASDRIAGRGKKARGDIQHPYDIIRMSTPPSLVLNYAHFALEYKITLKLRNPTYLQDSIFIFFERKLEDRAVRNRLDSIGDPSSDSSGEEFLEELSEELSKHIEAAAKVHHAILNLPSYSNELSSDREKVKYEVVFDVEVLSEPPEDVELKFE